MSATYEIRLESLEGALARVYDEWEAGYDDDSDEEDSAAREENRTRIKQTFLDTLTQIVAVIRDAEVAHYDGLLLLVEKVDDILNEASLFASDEVGPYEGTYVPSFAHFSNEGFIMDTSHDGKFCAYTILSKLPSHLSIIYLAYGFLTQVLPFMKELYRKYGLSPVCLISLFLLMNIAFIGTEVVVRNPDEVFLELPKPWKKTVRPHPLSTPCARFKEPLTNWVVTNSNERATSVLQARCEIGSGDIHSPIDMVLSSNGNVLALSSMGGWKNRTPYLWYYLPNHEDDYDFLKKHSITADLASSLDNIFLDERKHLMFVADYNRVKSYRYNLPSGTDRVAKAKGVHTMNSSNYAGPITLLGSDRLLRAGKGSVAIWELDALQTHGESGKDIIGDKIDEDDMETWRDDPEDIEPSTGSSLSATIKLEGCKSARDGDGPEIKNWHQHPSNANVLLCGMDAESSNNFCHAYDFQVEGKIVARYLGHGGAVEGFSTSPLSNPHVFLTRCSDGHARLYDLRHPLPTMTIACTRELEPIGAAVIAEPDGIPCMFSILIQPILH